MEYLIQQVKKKKFYFAKSITDKVAFIQISILPSAYNLENLKNEIKRIIIEEGHFTEVDYPFTIWPIFLTLGSITETSRQETLISFLSNDSIGNLLGFTAVTIYEDYNLSPNPTDILSFDKIFSETDFAQRKIFKGKRSRIIHIFNMDAVPGYKVVEKTRDGGQRYMMESKDFI